VQGIVLMWLVGLDGWSIESRLNELLKLSSLIIKAMFGIRFEVILLLTARARKFSVFF
jgi:hypothetical protein